GGAGGGHQHSEGGCPGKLLSPTRRRAAVERVRRVFGVSERRACRVLGQARSSQRYAAREPERDRELRARLRALSARHPRYGYRRIWALVRREGWRVNRKRVQRLWREEGLRVPRRQRKRRSVGGADRESV